MLLDIHGTLWIFNTVKFKFMDAEFSLTKIQNMNLAEVEINGELHFHLLLV